MTFFYNTLNNHQLFNSLTRYFNCILKSQLIPLSNLDLLTENSMLFIHKDDKENPELLKALLNKGNLKIFTIGFDEHSAIDLVNLSNLKTNISNILNQVAVQSLLSDDEIKEKLKNFFHSHGEDSLFEYLNWTIYYIGNGPVQFIQNTINYDEYINLFLTPGLKRWEYFKTRFYKYKEIIKISIYASELSFLEEAINAADSYIMNLKKMNVDDMQKNNIAFYEFNIGKFKKIEDIIGKIYRIWSFGKSPLQNPYR